MAMAAEVEMDHQTESHKTDSSVLVVGMGETGIACARYLAARGVHALFADSRLDPPGLAAIVKAMPDAALFAGDSLAEIPPGIDHIIISPGVDLEHPLMIRAREQNVEILSDIDVFGLECAAPVITITGTNGKSTVTTMLGEMLSVAGRKTAIGGNLGEPALNLLDPEQEFYVLELSSFQLERSRPVSSVAAVVLNIVPDHLDQHSGFESYITAKAYIYVQCETAIVNRDLPELAELVPADKPMIGFGLGEPKGEDFGVVPTSDGEFIAQGDELLMPVTGLLVHGRHNLTNALAALALGYAAGVTPIAMLPGLKSFKGLPHRMQPVPTDDEINWIDDSKATNVTAAVTSIQSIPGRLVLIAGGDGKGADFQDLAKALSGRRSVAILLGTDKERLAAELEDHCEIRITESLPAAVAAARQIASPGDTVLLAPACSSLDMFDGFSHRGDVFQEAIRESAS